MGVHAVIYLVFAEGNIIINDLIIFWIVHLLITVVLLVSGFKILSLF